MHQHRPCPGPHGSGHSLFDPSKLHVITTISNPVRYASRYQLYKDFAHHMLESGVDLWTVELAYGDRSFEVTSPDNPRHVQLRTKDEIWHKENTLNIGIQRLPVDWEYVAWIDADIKFVRPDWVQETIQQLQHHHFVQMWETAIDLGPHNQALGLHHSFMSRYVQTGQLPNDYAPPDSYYYDYDGKGYIGHPGYAWAADREGLEAVGGLIDTAILGAADHHMAHGLVGSIHRSHPRGLNPGYTKKLYEWQARAERYVRRDVGYVAGSIMHHWHGRKKDRRYHDRWQILTKNQYNPDIDLKRDYQGVYQLHDTGSPRSIQLRDDVRRYFRVRNEDSIDL
jgi:hypothetical protein